MSCSSYNKIFFENSHEISFYQLPMIIIIFLSLFSRHRVQKLDSIPTIINHNSNWLIDLQYSFILSLNPCNQFLYVVQHLDLSHRDIPTVRKSFSITIQTHLFTQSKSNPSNLCSRKNLTLFFANVFLQPQK